ncbi:MAG: cytochrome c [Gammaproteobacteria bacterium]|jgi:mono/diheme cytochrome c family protein|nr:cytochrome c [Gammaproteobacteria bacterium]
MKTVVIAASEIVQAPRAADSLASSASRVRRSPIARTILVTLLVVAGQLSAGTGAVAEDMDTYSVSQEAWSGGMQSGAGNYMGNCLACHGATGGGDGPLADSLGGDIKPRSLADPSLLSVRTDAFLFDVIKKGGKSVGLSELMPDWGETFDDEAIRNLVQYIRNDLCKCQYEGAGGP